MSVQRFLRFVPKSDESKTLIGQPLDDNVDVGSATLKSEDISVRVWSGKSILERGAPTEQEEKVSRVLSPLTQTEVGTIRCIGLNYTQHANEVNMAIPKEPTLFLKPSTSLADPYPAPTVIPKFTLADDCCDYESELVIIIGKDAKNVPKSSALDYVLGYTAANDVSSRATQFSQGQWCYSKGFDGACPIGPVVVLKESMPDPSKFMVRGSRNGNVMQECGTDDLIFSVAKLVSFLSQGTTLPAGTIILTGTPAGVGVGKKPPAYLRDGDEFSVQITPYIGTLTTKFVAEK